MAWLEFHNVTKRFPGVLALNQVTFGLDKGGCHALMGENGAGKSTLGKILAGVYTADSGTIRLDGVEVAPANPLEARRLGIAIVHQELAFCPNLSVAENLCLGDLPRRAGFVQRAEMAARASALLQQIDSQIDPRAPIGSLSTAQEQLVQIAAAVGLNARVIIMDEPTSSLSTRETEQLFHLIQKLKQRGVTLIYVSHRMEEIFRVCDTVTVLRDGRHVATESIAQTSHDRLVTQMIGRNVELSKRHHSGKELGGEILQVQNLSSSRKFKDIHFSLHRGEILGFGGLVGAGRSEVAQAIFGLDPNATGEISVKGQPLELGSVDAALAAGIGFLPEDRKRMGLVLSMNCRENTTLAALPLLSKGGFVQRNAERLRAADYIDRLNVKTPALDSLISGLSGGNQQKIAFAKWLARQCDILIVDEPTRGVDVGAKAEIHHLLDELACAGTAILLISSELPELMNLSRRIIVLREGNQAAELFEGQITEEALMRAMAGLV